MDKLRLRLAFRTCLYLDRSILNGDVGPSCPCVWLVHDRNNQMRRIFGSNPESSRVEKKKANDVVQDASLSPLEVFLAPSAPSTTPKACSLSPSCWACSRSSLDDSKGPLVLSHLSGLFEDGGAVRVGGSGGANCDGELESSEGEPAARLSYWL